MLCTPLSPFETPAAIDEICDSFNRIIDTKEVDPLILIPMFIHDFLCIHPFNDGNGRMSRLLTTLLLYRSGYFVGKYISLESKIKKNKMQYYDSLEECQKDWHEGKKDTSAFIKYLLKTILACYCDFEDRVKLIEEKLPAVETVRRVAYSKIGKITKSDIMEMCPSLGRATIENILKKLVEDGSLIRHNGGRSTYYTRNDTE